MQALAIMKANNVLQTKYIASMLYGISFDATSIGSSVHIVIDDVTQNMNTTRNDAFISKELTKITINDNSYSDSKGTWTSTIEPPNSRVELNCVVVEVNGVVAGDVVTAKCVSESTWDESVFNRVPIWFGGVYNTHAYIGSGTSYHKPLFGTNKFKYDGSYPDEWNESIRYDVTGNGSSLTIGNQLTIKDLPIDFVSHWVDTIHTKAYMGANHAMLVPPDQ